MIAYLDSSVVLRLVLGEPGSLKEWADIAQGVSSAISRVECLRTIDRLRISGRIRPEDAVPRLEALHGLLAAIDLVEPDRHVLERAAQPSAVALGTLDAIHLATALLWRELAGKVLVMATHDVALGMAARAEGLKVIGL